MKYLNHEYHDRGMKKWAGFYLSEHSATQEKEGFQRDLIITQKPQMSESAINQILVQATSKQKALRVQLAEVVDGSYLPDIVGFYQGNAEDGFYIQDHLINIEQINNITIEEPIKWSNVNYQTPIWDNNPETD